MSSLDACVRCGAPPEGPSPERCRYCGAYWLALSPLERSTRPETRGRFRSLRGLYLASFVGGSLFAAVIYLALFNHLSETTLVRLSVLWALPVVFGLGGLYTEKSVALVVAGRAQTFHEGLRLATGELSPLLRLGVYVVFAPPLLALRLDRIASPLRASALTALLWSGLLWAFFEFVFPSL
ncbi:MAG TPA: hypothetical protein VFS43_13095 [Polyangiaceae bacterium]|nr:hypothetical protein [Polyangiaceae bacterium]